MKLFARNQIRNSVSQETKHKTAKHQKNNWLYFETIGCLYQQNNNNLFK